MINLLYGGDIGVFFLFFFFLPPQGLCKNAVLINDLSKAAENGESC